MNLRVGAAPPLFNDPLVVVFAFLLLGVALPARLIVGSLGGLGSPAMIVSVGAFVLYGIARLVPGLLVDGFQPIRTALLWFGCVALASYAVGQTKALSVGEAASSDRALIAYAGYIGLGLITADAVRNRRHLDRLLGFVIIATSALAVLGIAQFITGIAPDTYISLPGLTLREYDVYTERSMFLRATGTALHPIEFGVVLAAVLPVAMHYAIHGTALRPPSRWRWLPVVLILVASPMAISRSTVLGIAVAIAMLAVTWSGRQRLNLAVTGIVMLVALRAVFPGLLGTLRSMFTSLGEDPSIAGRTEDYPRLLEFFQESPWLGRGLGTWVPSEHFILDNEYLGTLVAAGLLGLVALVTLFVVTISIGRSTYHHASDPATRSLGQALAAAVLVSAVTWGTFDGLAFRLSAGLAFILFGATGALWRLEVGRPRWGEAVNSRRPVFTSKLSDTPTVADARLAGAEVLGASSSTPGTL